MKQRGRKSETALTLSSLAAVRVERPEPPLELTDAEAGEWSRLIDALPADWIRPQDHALLVQYVRHVVATRRLGLLIDRLYRAKEYDLAELRALLAEQRSESATIKTLMTALRLTPQARYRPETAATRASKDTGPKPWES